MFKRGLLLSALLFFSLPVLIGCGSERIEATEFSETRVELIVENVTVQHREDMVVRDRGEHGIDMMLGEQRFVNINPSGLEVDVLTLEIAQIVADAMGLIDATELEEMRINNQDAFLVQGGMEIDDEDYLVSVLFFLANGNFYSMSYIASEELFEVYYPYFVEIRDSIGEIEIVVLTLEEVQDMVIEAIESMDKNEYIEPFGRSISPSLTQLADWLDMEIDLLEQASIERISALRENTEGISLPGDTNPNESTFAFWSFDYEVDDDGEMTLRFTLVHDIEIEEPEPLEPVSLFAGEWEGGTDVPAGRWVITGTGSGNFVIWRGTDLRTNEILGEGRFGVASITTDIADGDEISISGLNNVTFTPVTERSPSTSLSAGHWVVGEDIEAGAFDATTPSGSGNFVIWRGNSLRTNEILGDGSFGVERVRVNLANGDRISISGLDRVDFE